MLGGHALKVVVRDSFCGSGGTGLLQYVSFLTIFLTMPSLSERIVEHVSSLPEGTPICAGALLHLGNRVAVDQALSRLARSGRLMRVCQGIYMMPVETRFGRCAPGVDKGIEALAALWNETIVPCGGAAAHVLGLTTQIPVRSVYLTSGPGRRLRFGSLEVELRHAPRWQLTAPHRRAGDVVRALAWLGPTEIQEGLQTVLPGLSREDLDELAEARATMPHWMAEPVSALVAYG